MENVSRNQRDGHLTDKVKILEQSDRRHPDFSKSFKYGERRCDQNRVWDRRTEGGPAEIKAIFGFNSTDLLDDAPFVIKIIDNKTARYKYFGVAYARWDNRIELSQWAQKFPDAKLFTHRGEFLQRLSD